MTAHDPALVERVAEAIRYTLAIHPWGTDLPYPFSEYVERLKLKIADAAISAHLEALEEAARIESDRVDRVRAICREALTDYVDEGEPVLAQYILDALDGKES